MQTSEIIATIDSEIERLRQAKTLLLGAAEAPAKRRGRPRGSAHHDSSAHQPLKAKTTKRSLSAEGKARIAAAQKARWAAKRKNEKPASKTVKGTATKATTRKAAKKKARTMPAKKRVAAETPDSSSPAASEATAT